VSRETTTALAVIDLGRHSATCTHSDVIASGYAGSGETSDLTARLGSDPEVLVLVGQTTREQPLLTVQPYCSATGDRILSVSGRTLTFMRGYIASNQTDAELLTPLKPRGAAVPFILRVQCSRGDRRRLRASPNRHADEH